ncbi:molybdate ABC transporter substrate-binding protein [Virgibacillus sp. NKC19-3]|uniref:molybdate ABC transporter substrate-binding protein n=1 Tax=Virgibacillus saliphilus TaxID=2831674 RepID=UPI001C9B4095|nr:molybdate ABC transporter substrate-binding protein [Virgibacillus sp. NKC19-3]MBY7144979.1 molybdate ABC transporter substrate-binding protein [Virgibacillus sp. NKC19-3]
MQKQFTFIGILLCLLLIVTACANDQSTDQSSDNTETETEEEVELTISAAASLNDAMDEIQAIYQEEHPEVDLKFNFGSSGSLQQQISQGAPADLFFSAAEDKFDILVSNGDIAEEDGKALLGNELVMIVPEEEEAVTDFADLATSEAESIAIGTPESVPAGEYAKESLENMDLWEEIEPKIVYAKDVRQVLSYVETKNVDAGMVYKTDALISDEVNIVSTAASDTHAPITYPVGILKDSEHYEAAEDFYNFLQSDTALKVFEEYGFTTD